MKKHVISLIAVLIGMAFLGVLPTTRNNRHEHHGIGSGQTVTDPVANAALQNNEWRGAKTLSP